MEDGGHSVSRALFEANLHQKARSHVFRNDIKRLLRPGLDYDIDVAFTLLQEQIISRLPGDPWKGDGESQPKA